MDARPEEYKAGNVINLRNVTSTLFFANPGDEMGQINRANNPEFICVSVSQDEFK